ncbi:MAG: LysM peptidoglycan-binding domain-containing protein [Phycisphaerales bacterium]
MEEQSSKIYFGLCVLVLIWIGVYWAWDPNKADTVKISIAQSETENSIFTDEPNAQVPSVDDEQPSAPAGAVLVQIADPQTTDLTSAETSVRDAATPGLENTPVLVKPEFDTHVVAQGEILQDIASRYYGRASMWNVIARANPRVDPLKLREGMELRIPVDPDNIQGRVVGEEGASESETDDTTVEYLVQSGDSLSLIAKRFYGSSKHADFIYESNRDVLRSMDSIQIGQTLMLPPLDQ